MIKKAHMIPEEIVNLLIFLGILLACSIAIVAIYKVVA